MNKVESLRDKSMYYLLQCFPKRQVRKSLKKQVRKPSNRVSLLSELAECALDDDLPTDLAEQHDHYLYGTPRK